jgi:hypothetical protein
VAYTLPERIIEEFILTEIDPTAECRVTFRQGMTQENQQRDRLVFGGQARTFTDSGLRLEGTVAWTEREELECRLTMVGAVAFNDTKGKPLFRFRNGTLAMSDQQFHNAWGKLPPHVATLLHLKCLDVNPDWDFRPRPDDEEDAPKSAEESETE